jgi:signal peptidase I
VAKKRMPGEIRLASDKRAHVMREIVETLLFVGLIVLIVQFAIRPVRVVDDSMVPHLFPNQLVIVNHAAYLLAGPSRGDVVVYYDPTNPSLESLGRVIAVPGDTISISISTVTVNNVVLNETYLQSTGAGQVNEGVVPKKKLGNNDYFIMFDNRAFQGSNCQTQSCDSRVSGPIPRQNILGRAVLVFWPFSQVGGISNYSDVFQNVH